jgi:hypothetical protein
MFFTQTTSLETTKVFLHLFFALYSALSALLITEVQLRFSKHNLSENTDNQILTVIGYFIPSSSIYGLFSMNLLIFSANLVAHSKLVFSVIIANSSHQYLNSQSFFLI